MALLYYHFPIAILAKGITKTSLSNALEFAAGSYMEENAATIIEARDDLGFSNGNEDVCRKTFERYKNSRTMTSISREQYWQWFHNIENESNYSKLLLLAFLAVKSIVGQKKYAITNYDFLLARMAGDNVPRYKTTKGKKTLILPPHIERINTRRRLEQIREDLRKYHVATWGQQGLRGFAISTKLKEVELAHMIATNGTKSKVQLAKERKDNVKAKLKELQWLNG